MQISSIISDKRSLSDKITIHFLSYNIFIAGINGIFQKRPKNQIRPNPFFQGQTTTKRGQNRKIWPLKGQIGNPVLYGYMCSIHTTNNHWKPKFTFKSCHDFIETFCCCWKLDKLGSKHCYNCMRDLPD